VEVRIARVEEPSIAAGVDGDTGVPERMADQRNQQDLGRQSVDLAYALETEPALAAVRAIRSPVRPRRPLPRPKALTIEPRFLPHRGIPLRLEQMHGRARKVVEASGVIEVEMGQNDVPNVRRIEPPPAHLPRGRHLLAK